MLLLSETRRLLKVFRTLSKKKKQKKKKKVLRTKQRRVFIDNKKMIETNVMLMPIFKEESFHVLFDTIWLINTSLLKFSTDSKPSLSYFSIFTSHKSNVLTVQSFKLGHFDCFLT